MIISEYRIPLPLTLEEYEIGQLFTTVEMSKNETGGGDGVEILCNESFNNDSSDPDKSQYTYKIYHLSKKVPAFIKNLVPEGKLALHEESWNTYPNCKTEIKMLDFIDKGFSITIQTYHANGKSNEENIFNLPHELLKKCNIIYMDIVNDPIPGNPEYDPSKFNSVKAKRGPFTSNWIEKQQPIMTCYKLVIAEFEWFGMQSRVERLIQATEKKLFFLFHRMLLCSMDKWFGLPVEEIRKIEKQGAIDLHKMRFENNVKDTIPQYITYNFCKTWEKQPGLHPGLF